MESVPPPYEEVQPHWFFCRRADDKTSWLPFSREDSDKLENALNSGENEQVCQMYNECLTCFTCTASLQILSLLLKMMNEGVLKS